jgi:hypothetical protein
MRRPLRKLQRALRRRWPHWRRAAGAVLVAGIAALILYAARSVNWPQVWSAMRAIPARNLAIAGLLAAAGYMVYGGLDLLGRIYSGHKLGRRAVLGIAMLSYAFNLNLGVLIGGLGVRFRLYTRMGCRKVVPTRVALFSALSNWIGFSWLAGIIFLSGVVPVPEGWEIGGNALRLLGVGLVAMSAAYVAICATARRRAWTLAGHRVWLPSGRMALAQSMFACVSWALMGGAVYVLMGEAQPYVAVLGVLLCASMAALLARVPGGLGATEAIFVAAFGTQLPESTVLGAVLAYRALYFLAPLGVALAALPAAEAWMRRRSAAVPACVPDEADPHRCPPA